MQKLAVAFRVASVSAVDGSCKILDTTAGQHAGTCQGIQYTYRVPKQCADATEAVCGLILDVHGWTMNGDIQDLNSNTRALGEEHGFVVVQPSANRHGVASSWSSHDDPKVWAILEAARDEPALHVDSDRVHFMGFSQGSMMTWRMVAAYGSQIASAVPMSCPADDPRSVAANAGGVPILYSSGYKDGLCSFASNAETLKTLNQTWGLAHGKIVSQDEHYVRTTYQGTGGQYLETLFWDYDSGNGGICGAIYKEIGAGHCFPGGHDTQCFGTHPRVSFPQKLAPFSCPYPDPSAAGFKIGEVAVQFFLDHPRTSRATVV